MFHERKLKDTSKILSVFWDDFSDQRIRNLDINLESEWRRRAQLFYSEDYEFPYIDHVYSSNYEHPYTCDDPDVYVGRRNISFVDRSKTLIGHLKVRKLGYLRPVNPFFQSLKEDETLDQHQSISSASYYFQLFRFQFYRLLLILWS